MADYSLADVKDKVNYAATEDGGFTQNSVTDSLSQYFSIGGLGSTVNEVSTTYVYSKGAHHIKLLDRVSPEVVLVFMSQMVGFHLKVQSGDTSSPTDRELKKNILITADLI